MSEDRAGFDYARAERERAAYDEGDVAAVNISWHERFGHVFASPNTRRGEERFDALARAAVAGEEVLDIGCGKGRNTERLLDMGAARVLGVDISQSAIDIASERTRPGLEFRCADVTGEVEGTFGCIFGRAILHHLDYRGFLPRLYERNLLPGGTMLFMEPQGEHLLLRLYTRLVASAHTPDERSFTRNDLDWLTAQFPRVELYPINYLSFGAALLTSRLPGARADGPLLRACDRADEWLARRAPRLLSHYRQTIVAIHKPAR